MEIRTFEQLTPHLVTSAVEEAYGLTLDGMLTGYPSYVNRVYGLRDDDGNAYVAKFYRPGRWTDEAIREEHRFVADCAAREVPVVPPMAGKNGETLHEVRGEDGPEIAYRFAIYPRRGGRSFDAEEDDDWVRLGSIVGRIHAAALGEDAPHRLVCTPAGSTLGFIEELRAGGVVHPACREEFFKMVENGLAWVAPLFDGVRTHRIHGDCHRGNILDRPGEGLMIIDFDDMMVGPAVQDLWLLLPDRAHACYRELELILEGYEQFRPFDRADLRLIEPLRLMRILYYLAWSARQREDRGFMEAFPGWGSEAFWIKEIEDVRTQLDIIRDDLEGEEPNGQDEA